MSLESLDGTNHGMVAGLVANGFPLDCILLVGESERDIVTLIYVIQRCSGSGKVLAVRVAEVHVLEVEGGAPAESLQLEEAYSPGQQRK